MNIKDNYDLIIVGGGAAGMTAAYEASEKGLSTLVVEKGHQLGGSGNYIEGAFAVDSFMQKKHSDYHLTKEEALNEELNIRITKQTLTPGNNILTVLLKLSNG